MSEPILHLGDVGVVVEGIGCGGRAQSIGADIEAEQGGIVPDQPVYPARRNRILQGAGCVVADRPDEGTGIVVTMPQRLQIFED